MDRHPDSDTLLAFREHRLAGAAVAEVALHLGGCATCATVEPSAVKRAFEALVPSAHLTDEELDTLVDGDAPLSGHAAECAMCRAEAEDLRRFAEGGGRPGRKPAGVTPDGIARRGTRRAGERDARPPWLIAAAVVFAVLALSAIALLLRRPAPDVVPVTASNTPPTPIAPPRVIASLADGPNHIALLENGTIAGVTARSPRDADDARAVLSGRAIAIPTFIAAMPGAVRGGGASAHPLRAVAPFRSAVLGARPRFSWTAVRGARSYRVAVFDADYEEIARSGTLTGTSWTPAKPLPAGVDLSWHVVADTAAGELSSAGSDRAEAVFRVLAPDEAGEVEAGKAQYSGSGLMRGLLYSRHGLLHDAEREFRGLAEQNPGSPVARALVESVRR